MTREQAKTEARRLRREERSIPAIAAQLGLPRSTVADWLRGVGQATYVKTCWCGETFVSRRADALSCSHAHGTKRWTLFGPVRQVRRRTA